jgi:hypothetical protein
VSDQLDLKAPGELTVAAAPRPEQTLLEMIARAAADPASDVDKLERLMGLYERHMAREAHTQYTQALAEMQPELPIIEEHGEITDRAGNVQSKYAKLEDIAEAIKPVLARHGFSLTFAISQDGAKLSVTGKLSHRSGHVEATTMELPADTSGNKNTVQAWGSSTAYGMRYTARALLNLTSRGDDDDGQAGGTALITEGQLEALRALAETAGADLRRFCEFLKVTSLDQLPQQRYRIAEQALQDKIVQAQRVPPSDPADDNPPPLRPRKRRP